MIQAVPCDILSRCVAALFERMKDRTLPPQLAEEPIVHGPDADEHMPPLPPPHFLLDQKQGDLPRCSQVFAVDLAESPCEDLVRALVQQLAQTHEALRLRFRQDKAGWHQTLTASNEAVPFVRADLSVYLERDQEAAMASMMEDMQNSLDMTVGPLAYVVLFYRGADRTARLALAIHDMIIDRLPWPVLRQDILTGLGQQAEILIEGNPLAG